MLILCGLSQTLDKEFITKLYNKEKKKHFRVAMSILNGKILAEEAVSNTYLKIIEKIDMILKLPKEKIPAYCMTILKNECYNIIRKEKKYVHTENIDTYVRDDRENQIEEDVVLILELQDLQKVINTLKEEDQTLIMYRYYYDFTFKEIGELLDISESAASKRHQRILKKIREGVE